MATLFLGLTVAGCGSRSTLPPPTMPTPAHDSVSGVTDLSPVLGTTLSAGQTVTLRGTAGYTLSSADTGVLVMVLEDQAHQPLQPAQTQALTQVVKGSGQATLSQTITLPGTGITSVRLIFVLFPTGATNSIASTGVTYAVK